MRNLGIYLAVLGTEEVKAWMRANWFALLVALWTSLTALSGVLTDWLALGFGWGLLNDAHDALHGHTSIEQGE